MTGDHQHDDDHFDEVDAVRRFPSADEWLDLPMPTTGQPADWQSSGAFADRVMREKREADELDRQLARLDVELPGTILQQHLAPEPDPVFVERTLTAIRNDRRQRWQAMLARYVAPEPSPAFVSRTLAALAEHAANADGQSPAADGSATGEGGTSRTAASRQRPWPALLLTALAAAALLWLVLAPRERPPLELRFARQADPTSAYANSWSPLATTLARVAEEDEPFALAASPVDGLWLASASGARR